MAGNIARKAAWRARVLHWDFGRLTLAIMGRSPVKVETAPVRGGHVWGKTKPPRGAARLRRRTQMPAFRQFNRAEQRHSVRWSLQWFATVCKSRLT